MKKLLTLILPALALTTGEPMAADYYSAFSSDGLGTGPSRYLLCAGKNSYEEMKQGMRALCKAQGVSVSDCDIAHSGAGRCIAVGVYVSIRGGTGYYWGGNGYGNSKEEAIEAAIQNTGGPGSNYDVSKEKAMLASCDCLVPGAAQVEAKADTASPAPAQAGAAPASGERYGAFAIDEGAWAYGFSLLAPSPDEANRAALARCVQEGGDECEIKYVFNGSRCGAAAVAEEQGLRAWGYGHAESRYEAVDTALGFCERDNTSGGECRLVSVACGE